MREKTIKVAIIIINYNGENDTIQCISSLDKHLEPCQDGIVYYIALLDNASSEPFDKEKLKQFRHNIYFYQSESNLGFAGGNNLAIKLITKAVDGIDYYLLLNNDTVLVDDSISNLVKKTDESSFSISGLVNYYYDNPDQCWQAGAFFRPNCIKGKEIQPLSDCDLFFTEVDTVPGSSLLVKKSVIDAIGLLDERYFAYYEEVELCERARRAHYNVAFLNGTRLLHKVGRASTSYYKHYLRTRNTLLLYSDYYPSLMGIARLRVLFRTIKCLLRTGKIYGYLRAYHSGVNDFHNKKFGK